MRAIDADALMKDVRENSESYFADDFAEFWVNRQPTIQPESHWIPCSERLPEKEGYFLVTVSCMGVIYVDARFYYVERDSRHWGNYESGSVIAWMPLPEPFKGVTE